MVGDFRDKLPRTIPSIFLISFSSLDFFRICTVFLTFIHFASFIKEKPSFHVFHLKKIRKSSVFPRWQMMFQYVKNPDKFV